MQCLKKCTFLALRKGKFKRRRRKIILKGEGGRKLVRKVCQISLEQFNTFQHLQAARALHKVDAPMAILGIAWAPATRNILTLYEPSRVCAGKQVGIDWASSCERNAAACL